MHFWETVQLSETKQEVPEFLSTHPSNAKRAENLNEILPWALDIRRQCNCYPLPIKKTLGALNLSKNPDEKVRMLVVYEMKKKFHVVSSRLWSHLVDVLVVSRIFLSLKLWRKNKEFVIFACLWIVFVFSWLIYSGIDHFSNNSSRTLFVFFRFMLQKLKNFLCLKRDVPLVH